jgi:catechol 2,3-dioxygenase-like lactoylglutathione lyase family enzyme
VSQYGHIDLRVSDMAAARKFYDQLLPELGFTEKWDGETWTQWATTEPRPSTAHFAITEEPGHIANSNRIAFWVSSGAEVDRVTAVARAAGATGVSGPKPMPYDPGYYASFFADPSGNLLEVYVQPE